MLAGWVGDALAPTKLLKCGFAPIDVDLKPRNGRQFHKHVLPAPYRQRGAQHHKLPPASQLCYCSPPMPEFSQLTRGFVIAHLSYFSASIVKKSNVIVQLSAKRQASFAFGLKVEHHYSSPLPLLDSAVRS